MLLICDTKISNNNNCNNNNNNNKNNNNNNNNNFGAGFCHFKTSRLILRKIPLHEPSLHLYIYYIPKSDYN